jgi:hypothetical protein
MNGFLTLIFPLDFIPKGSKIIDKIVHKNRFIPPYFSTFAGIIFSQFNATFFPFL